MECSLDNPTPSQKNMPLRQTVRVVFFFDFQRWGWVPTSQLTIVETPARTRTCHKEGFRAPFICISVSCQLFRRKKLQGIPSEIKVFALNKVIYEAAVDKGKEVERCIYSTPLCVRWTTLWARTVHNLPRTVVRIYIYGPQNSVYGPRYKVPL